MSNDPGIIYYGTPEFAVESLAGLIKAGFRIMAVVTAPDKPSGRGLKMTSSPVKRFALDHGLKVLQPDNLKSPMFIGQLHDLKPDLQAVVAFRMMPREVWALPPLGTFNLHASLLPQYRGAAPINHAIINGERETGVTTFLLDEKIDTGKILFREKTRIDENETAGELHDRLMILGAELVVKSVDALARGLITPVSQSEISGPGAELKKAPKIHPADCEVNWASGAEDLHNLIRGLSPYPGAHTTLSDTHGQPFYLKITRATPEFHPHNEEPGSISTDGKNYFKIAVRDGWIRLTEIQPSGRKSMKIEDFLMGFGRRFL